MVRLAVFALVAVVGTGLVSATGTSDLPISPKPTSRVSPVYPAAAIPESVPGDTLLAVTVVEGGAVSDVAVLSEAPAGYGFGDAAMAAVKQWTFATAAPGTYQVGVKFVVQ